MYWIDGVKVFQTIYLQGIWEHILEIRGYLHFLRSMTSIIMINERQT